MTQMKNATGELIEKNADDSAANIPGWSSWDNTQAQSWLTNNVEPEIGTLYPNTYQAIQAMIQLELAIRDKLWPHLAE